MCLENTNYISWEADYFFHGQICLSNKNAIFSLCNNYLTTCGMTQFKALSILFGKQMYTSIRQICIHFDTIEIYSYLLRKHWRLLSAKSNYFAYRCFSTFISSKSGNYNLFNLSQVFAISLLYQNHIRLRPYAVG